MLRAFSLLAMVSLTLATGTATASVLPGPMRDAVDTYATQYAAYQEWTYVDRDALTAHGDYKRAYFDLTFMATIPASAGGKTTTAELTMNVQARVAKCGPGWYVVSTPMDRNVCRPRAWRW